MKNEAIRKDIPSEGLEGGLILDEMAIQSGLQFYTRDNKVYMTGFTDLGEETILTECLKSGNSEVKIATHVLQFGFFGIQWISLSDLSLPHHTSYCFRLVYSYLGNHQHVASIWIYSKIHKYWWCPNKQRLCQDSFGGYQVSTTKTMRIPNIYSPKSPNIIFIMDYSHVIKKIRNNISKSTSSTHGKRRLSVSGHYVLWCHFLNAHMWDIRHNPLPIHYHLNILNLQMNQRCETSLQKMS